MNFLRLLGLNLLYHRRGNFAVFLGVALGTAVLTGALLVGDSLRGSLRALALDQLGWIDQAMVTPRFFRDRLSQEISGRHSASALLLQASAVRVGKNASRRVNKITVLGIDDRFWPTDQVPLGQEFWRGDTREVVLNETLAAALRVKVGDSVALNLQKPDDIPREQLLGKRKQDDVVTDVEARVKAILPDEGMARFTLTPSPEPVRNAFVPIAFLQESLELTGRANAVFIDGDVSLKEELARDLQQYLTLVDWGLKLRSPDDRARSFVRFLHPNNEGGKILAFRWEKRVPPALEKMADAKGNLAVDDFIQFYREHRNYFLLESNQLLLEETVVKALRNAFPSRSSGHVTRIGKENWWIVPTFIYLADSISVGKDEIPYAVVAAQGRLLEQKDSPLKDDEIDIADWPEPPFPAKPGDTVTLSYYAPDDHSHLTKMSATFKVRKLFSLMDHYDDPDLVPEFKGITDKQDMASWVNPPFPFDKNRAKPVENYWKRFRTTPRAYISLDKAQALWGSRFGKLTSMRFLPMSKSPDIAQAMDTVRRGLLDNLPPDDGGFVFQDVRSQGLKAGGGSTDFGEYFLYFSFFLIVAALLLVGLLFRLNLDRRSQEIGVLLAVGWDYPRVRRLLLSEGGLLALLGALVGLGGALLYADWLLSYLTHAWPRTDDDTAAPPLSFLKLHATPLTFGIGLAASLLASFFTIAWATRILSKMSPRSLLAGETTASATDPVQKRSWSPWVAGISLLLAVVALIAGFFVEGHEAQAGSFFGGGFLMLTACLAAVWFVLRRGARHSNPRQSVTGLGMRNAGRHAVRSVLTVGLLASATFLIVAVEAFHKEPGQDFLEKTGGSGGFPLVAQSDVPIYEDLNAADVRGRREFPKGSGPLLDKVRIYSCRLHAGDDASCLNLYQPQKPRIIGVPPSLIDRGGFAFSRTLAETDAEKANPWLLLEKPADDSIPVFVDATSAQYILKAGLGDLREVPDEQGTKVKLRIVGLFADSIFQSEMVVAESSFRRLFPHDAGFRFFLIDGPHDKVRAIQDALEAGLGGNGFVAESTLRRVATFLAVENTYLSTFQALGGLGLLLGAVGLAIVLLRGVWERRGELALLRALGFRAQTLAVLVLAENAFLLVVGLATGVLAALLAVAPHLFGGEAQVLWLRIAGLLAAVVVVGLAAGLAAVTTTLRAPLIRALRRE